MTDYRILGEVPDVLDLWEHDGDVILVGKLDGVIYSITFAVDYLHSPPEIQREARHV